jgi:isopenicillin-N epimerase
VNPYRALWTLDPDVVFLNHGSFGACPRAVLEEQSEIRARIEREPVLFLGRELVGRLDAVKAELGPFLGAQPEDLAFVNNATTGVNAVLRSLPLEAGDEILLTDHGYNACNNAAEYVAREAGARCVVARVPFPLASPEEVVEAVLARVGPRTRLALLDHVTSPTGLVLPIARLVAELRERGVETLVDGAHAPGMLALDLDGIGAAYSTGNAHKWMCAPKGAAYLHVRRDLQDSVRPLVISHGANQTSPGRSRFRLEFDWMGTDDPSAVLALPAVLRFFSRLLPGGWAELRERNRALALEGRALLVAALGIEAPAPESMIGSLAAVPLPDAGDDTPMPRGADALKARLFDEHRIELPIAAWPTPGKRLLRISAQIYNSLDQYQVLVEALGKCGVGAGCAAR